MASTIPGVNTTRRTWSNNGVHMTLETSSYSTPGFSFGTFNAGTNIQQPNLFSSAQTTQPRAGGVLGAAFNILGNVLSSQARAANRGNTRRGSNQSYIDDDLAYSDDEDDFIEEEETLSPPKVSIPKSTQRTASNSQQQQRAPRNRGQSPVRKDRTRPQPESRSRSYRTEERKPSWTNGYRAYAEDVAEEDDNEDEYDNYYDKSRSRRSNRSFPAHDSANIRALENAAEHHRRELKNCRKRLEQVSKQRNVSSTVLQRIVNDLNIHEEAYEAALKNLEAAKSGRRGSNSSRRQTPHHSRPSPQERRSSTAPEDFFAGTGFERFFNGTSQRARPMFPGSDEFFVSFGSSPFRGFEHVFNDDAFFRLPRNVFVHESMPRSSFPGANSGPRFTYPTPNPTTFSRPTAKPPPNLLKPAEAKALFKKYNDRWNALAPIDPNIPFPCRGMQASGLSTRDTIWAPHVSSPISTWSAETIMQANAQAFYLGVAGLAPEYTEAIGKGKIVMGFDKTRASQEQVRALVEMLKKEKTRWHSDRLGRRNGGVEAAGPNESLQRDERARAVFHAVCELMEAAQ